MDIDDSVVVPKHPDRQRVRGPGISPAKCCTYVCGAFGVTAVVLFVGVMVYSFVQGILLLSHVHKEAFTANLAGVSAADISRPLVDLDTRFDVAVTIWARVPNSKTSRPEVYAEDWRPTEEDRSTQWPVLEGSLSMTAPEVPLLEHYIDPEEKILYSDIVIPDYSLHRKSEEIQIKFDLPLARFYDKSLYEHDVRATVVLLPHSPSRLDHVANVSTFMPSELRRYPWLSDFLRSSERVGADGSAYQQALESLAVTWPLIEFREEMINRTTEKTSLDHSPSTSDGSSQEVYHAPYLRTRLHAYIVNETRSTLRETQDGHFKHLSKESCKRIRSNGGPVDELWKCEQKRYNSYGHWTAQYRVDGDVDEVAYPPFVDDMPHAPKDAVRLPISQPGLFPKKGKVDLKIKMSIRFAFKFSTVHHRRQFAKDMTSLYVPGASLDYQAAATERKKADVHDGQQILFGALSGHADEGSRPWTRMLLGTVDILLSFSMLVLDATYWWTRRTSTGISFPGTWADVIGHVVRMERVWRAETVPQQIFQAVHFVFMFCLLDLPKLLMLLPLSIGNYGKGWTVYKRRRTHRERASRRREPRWWQALFFYYLGVSLVVGVLQTLVIDLALWFIPPVYPKTDIELLAQRGPFIFNAVFFTAILLQLALNHSSGTFARQFALTAWLHAAESLLHLAYFSTRIVGNYELHDGLSIVEVLIHCLNVGMLYQAIKYPRVEQVVPDDEDEE